MSEGLQNYFIRIIMNNISKICEAPLLKGKTSTTEVNLNHTSSPLLWVSLVLWGPLLLGEV